MANNETIPEHPFPDLYYPALKSIALRWVKKHPCIQKVTLYRGIEHKYVIAVQTPEPPFDMELLIQGGGSPYRNDDTLTEEEREVVQYCEWLCKDMPGECRHVEEDLREAYKVVPSSDNTFHFDFGLVRRLPASYIEEWFWLDYWWDTDIEEYLKEYAVSEFFWTIYDSKKVARDLDKHILGKRPSQKAKEEAVKIAKEYIRKQESKRKTPIIKEAVDLIQKKIVKDEYKDRTIHDWIKGYFPDESRRPGRLKTKGPTKK